MSTYKAPEVVFDHPPQGFETNYLSPVSAEGYPYNGQPPQMPQPPVQYGYPTQLQYGQSGDLSANTHYSQPPLSGQNDGFQNPGYNMGDSMQSLRLDIPPTTNLVGVDGTSTPLQPPLASPGWMQNAPAPISPYDQNHPQSPYGRPSRPVSPVYGSPHTPTGSHQQLYPNSYGNQFQGSLSPSSAENMYGAGNLSPHSPPENFGPGAPSQGGKIFACSRIGSWTSFITTKFVAATRYADGAFRVYEYSHG